MLRVGVIGTGMIGQDHIRRMTTVLAGVRVTAVTDVDAGHRGNGGRAGSARAVHATGEELIADPEVDAVVVCSWGPTHEQYVLASIAAGKPVFCEKPLATTQEACLRIVEAEVGARQPAGPGRLHAAVRRGVPRAEEGAGHRARSARR